MKKITIIGTGYVGLVTGAGLSEFGNRVICTDIDKNKIEKLNSGIIPIYEPGLEEIIKRNISDNRLLFSSNIEDAIMQSEVVIIAVGTPMGANGATDMSFVHSAVETISINLNSYKVVCTKSTVPIGTGKEIISQISKKVKNNNLFDYVSNPEFLREGSAVKDFLWPDRVVIGTDNQNAYQIMCDIYRPLYINKNPMTQTSIETAEMIKYASNSFLALKISYINEIANLCEALGADVHDVANAMGQDGRISEKFLHPGPGFGGSCFPKDLEALLYISKNKSLSMETVNAAIIVNKNQKKRMANKLINLFDGNINNRKIAVLGLAFKANTDDVRESPAIDIIKGILGNGGIVNAYDPIANNEMSKIFHDIEYFDNIYDAVKNVDGIVIITEWNEFRSLDLQKIKKIMKGNIILDTRNILDMDELSSLGFVYDNIGRIKK
jgi:UDPglucose 6-dehydrogenase